MWLCYLCWPTCCMYASDECPSNRNFLQVMFSLTKLRLKKIVTCSFWFLKHVWHRGFSKKWFLPLDWEATFNQIENFDRKYSLRILSTRN